MRGRHHVILETKHLKYEFDICRNITVVQGDSATGKTTLVELVRDYSIRGESSGIRLQSDVKCNVFSGNSDSWETVLGTYKSSIVFFDEGYDFVFTKKFAEVILGTDNYYVIIARKALKNLPYSIKEIYGIRTTGKYHFPEQVYHEFYPLVDTGVKSSLICANTEYVLLVEDEKSGYQFFSSLTNNCVGVGGNSNFFSDILREGKNKAIYVVADGAAFGAYINDILELRKRDYNLSIYMPESFEWLILKSGVVSINNVKDVLEHPEDYIDSSEYITWERFFNDYLCDATKDDKIKKYSKSHLSEYYLSSSAKKSIVSILPDEIQEVMEKIFRE